MLGGLAMDAGTMSALVWLGIGLLGGTAYFALLRRVTLLFVTAGGLAHALMLQAARLVAIIALLSFATWFGPQPLLLAASGVLLARPLAMRFAVAP